MKGRPETAGQVVPRHRQKVILSPDQVQNQNVFNFVFAGVEFCGGSLVYKELQFNLDVRIYRKSLKVTSAREQWRERGKGRREERKAERLGKETEGIHRQGPVSSHHGSTHCAQSSLEMRRQHRQAGDRCLETQVADPKLGEQSGKKAWITGPALDQVR